MLAQLYQHAAVLIALSVLYDFLMRIRNLSDTNRKIMLGILFGGIAVGAMKMAVPHSSGMIYDGRSVILSLSGLFGGWSVACIAVLMAGTYRIVIGGVWLWSGLAAILLPALTGIVFRRIFRNQPHSASFTALFLFGLVVHLLLFVCPFFSPGGCDIAKQTWMSFLLVFPLATSVMAFLLGNEDRRSLAEKKLRESEENFRLSIDESPLGMHIVSETGETLYANKAFLDLYGFNTIRELTETPSENRYTPESFREHLVRREKRKKGEYVDPEYDIEIVRTDGKKRYLHVYRKKIAWGGIPQYHVIHQDITDNRHMLADLRKAKEKAEESDRLKSAFLANISHEIRTPLNAILGFTEMFFGKEELKPQTAEEFSLVIRRNAEELLQTISNVIDISKLELGQTELFGNHVSIQPLISDLYSGFRKKIADQDKKKVDLIWKMPESPVYMYTDKEKLFQIFYHLLDNSVKFTNKGTIVFGIEEITESSIHFFVSDTGIGIEDSFREVIFERFRQADHSMTRCYRGTGLGLSIVDGLVRLMKGTISLQSEPGKGTTVRFLLPVTLPPQREDADTDTKQTYTT